MDEHLSWSFEDAVIVSQQFADKIQSQIVVIIDNNEHPLDLYGDDSEVKFLPDIGDVII